MTTKTNSYLQQYLNSLPAIEKNKHHSVSSGYFCNDEESANNCSDLILQGIKTATCSMKHWYEIEAGSLPKKDDLHIVTNWHGEPTSIIQTIKVMEYKFKDVTEEFAKAEGEGDRSLDFWRKTHWKFFSDECKDIKIRPSEEMMLVLEWFQVVYQ